MGLNLADVHDKAVNKIRTSAYFDWDLLKQSYLWIRIANAVASVLILYSLFSFKACAHISFVCKNSNITRISVEQDLCMSYPFNLANNYVVDGCSHSRAEIDVYHINFSVFIKAFTLLVFVSLAYTAASLVGFLGWWSVYHSNQKYAFWDFLLTISLCSYWFSGTASFSSILSSMKNYASDDQLKANLLQLPSCGDPEVGSCTIGRDTWGHWGSLNTVLVLAYAEIILWALNSFWVLQKMRHIRSQPRLVDARDDGEEVTVYQEGDEEGEYRRLI